ncbi:hypothetical protein GCM10009836_24590 [Pseudonocardia ailaonensis]|uniref:Uncharacterized protein n=1 Tax=Pseudonocardia ailaonensis TaxID=367279 RepID=A0ABN2N0D8_9PSEU
MSRAAQTTSDAPPPRKGPSDIGVGSALITLVEPLPGNERGHNRWYEDDHFFAGAMHLPWLFSGRRWVATRDLQLLRGPDPSPIADPVTAGCYLGTYWIAPGRLDELKRWAGEANDRLVREGRIDSGRTHVFTSFQEAAGTVYRDDEVPRDVFTLVDPAPGLVLEAVDAPTAETRGELERWLLEEHLPAVTREPGSPVASAMVFRTEGPYPEMSAEVREMLGKVGAGGRRLTVLWFLTADPRDVWDTVFAGEQSRVETAGRGRVSLLAPFIPSRMGTNAYDDQLR